MVVELTRQEVQHIALLARINLNEQELQQMQIQLSNILSYFQALQKLDTTGVPPMTHSVPLHNVFRDDIVRPSLKTEDVLANAPQRDENSFKVKAVLEEQ